MTSLSDGSLPGTDRTWTKGPAALLPRLLFRQARRPAGSGNGAGRQPHILPPTGGLWAELERRVEMGQQDPATTLLIGFSASDRQNVLDALRTLDFGLTASVHDVSVLRDESPLLFDPFDVVMINIDAFDDLVDAVDACVAFRRRNPRVCVIIVSRDVQGDDLGAERRAICDATLRFPMTSQRMAAGLRAAAANLRERTERDARCLAG